MICNRFFQYLYYLLEIISMVEGFIKLGKIDFKVCFPEFFRRAMNTLPDTEKGLLRCWH